MTRPGDRGERYGNHARSLTSAVRTSRRGPRQSPAARPTRDAATARGPRAASRRWRRRRRARGRPRRETRRGQAAPARRCLRRDDGPRRAAGHARGDLVHHALTIAARVLDRDAGLEPRDETEPAEIARRVEHRRPPASSAPAATRALDRRGTQRARTPRPRRSMLERANRHHASDQSRRVSPSRATRSDQLTTTEEADTIVAERLSLDERHAEHAEEIAR